MISINGTMGKNNNKKKRSEIKKNGIFNSASCKPPNDKNNYKIQGKLV